MYISAESGQSELWLADRQLQNKRQLTRLGTSLKYPRWSHDGHKVVFVSRSAESVQDKLTILDVDTGQLSFIRTGFKMHGRPTWWHDDSALLLPHNGELIKFDLASLQSTVLTNAGGDFAQMTDSSGFYFSKGRTGGLWWQPLQDNQSNPAQAQQLLTAEEFSETYAWTVGEKGIYFLSGQADGVALRYWFRGAEASQQLVLLPAEQSILSATPVIDERTQRLVLEYSPVPRIDIMRWQLP